MNSCKVSVIIPLYNGEKYVIETLNSVLNQTYKDFEIIIIDDASDDASYEIVKKFMDEKGNGNIHLFKNENNIGIAATRNKAIELSKGEYIAILDDDDIAPTERLKLSVEYLDSHPEVGVVGGYTCGINHEGKVVNFCTVAYYNYKYIRAHLLFKNLFINSEMMFRKNIVLENDIWYRNNCYGLEDFRFWVECSKVTNIIMLNELFLLHRIHNQNASSFYVKHFSKEREKCFAQIQKFSLEASGFKLTDTDYETFFLSVNECPAKDCSALQLGNLYKIFCKIIRQANELQLEEAEEVRIMCRQIFSSRFERYDIFLKMLY